MPDYEGFASCQNLIALDIRRLGEKVRSVLYESLKVNMCASASHDLVFAYFVLTCDLHKGSTIDGCNSITIICLL